MKLHQSPQQLFKPISCISTFSHISNEETTEDQTCTSWTNLKGFKEPYQPPNPTGENLRSLTALWPRTHPLQDKQSNCRFIVVPSGKKTGSTLDNTISVTTDKIGRSVRRQFMRMEVVDLQEQNTKCSLVHQIGDKIVGLLFRTMSTPPSRLYYQWYKNQTSMKNKLISKR